MYEPFLDTREEVSRLAQSIVMLNQIRDDSSRNGQMPAVACLFDLGVEVIEFLCDVHKISSFPYDRRFLAYRRLAVQHETTVSDIRSIEAGLFGLWGIRCASQ
jgi:hypothetical protein